MRGTTRRDIRRTALLRSVKRERSTERTFQIFALPRTTIRDAPYRRVRTDATAHWLAGGMRSTTNYGYLREISDSVKCRGRSKICKHLEQSASSLATVCNSDRSAAISESIKHIPSISFTGPAIFLPRMSYLSNRSNENRKDDKICDVSRFHEIVESLLQCILEHIRSTVSTSSESVLFS